jgi:rSAM/selenodomain-associated transferase 2
MTPASRKPSALTVIIPTLNEAEHIGPLLEQLGRAGDLEVIVVDGGSRDATVTTARRAGTRVIQTAPGRARQMNQGAAAARGRLLFFLHADSRLPTNFAALVRRALAAPGVSAAAFRLAIDAPGAGLRFVEFWANLRSRYLQMPYGDQGLGLTAACFRELGGFPDLPIMEDFELVCRLRSRGRIAILPAAIRTSPRRWLNLGVGRTTVTNQFIVLAYMVGVPPQQLARLYRRSKGIG